jgi:hypothetical protein
MSFKLKMKSGSQLIRKGGAERNTDRKRATRFSGGGNRQQSCFACWPCDKTITFTFMRPPPRSCRVSGPIPPDRVATSVNRSAMQRDNKATVHDVRDSGIDY